MRNETRSKTEYDLRVAISIVIKIFYTFLFRGGGWIKTTPGVMQFTPFDETLNKTQNKNTYTQMV